MQAGPDRCGPAAVACREHGTTLKGFCHEHGTTWLPVMGPPGVPAGGLDHFRYQIPPGQSTWRLPGTDRRPATGPGQRGGGRVPPVLVRVCWPGGPVAAGRRQELTGITVVDLDASIEFAVSGKANAQATYKGGIGFCPNLAACDNTGDMLAIDPRPGGATSIRAADNAALLDLAVSRLPGPYRGGCWSGLDGAGFSHDLLEHIAVGGGVQDRAWVPGPGGSPSARHAPIRRWAAPNGCPQTPGPA